MGLSLRWGTLNSSMARGEVGTHQRTSGAISAFSHSHRFSVHRPLAMPGTAGRSRNVTSFHLHRRELFHGYESAVFASGPAVRFHGNSPRRCPGGQSTTGPFFPPCPRGRVGGNSLATGNTPLQALSADGVGDGDGESGPVSGDPDELPPPPPGNSAPLQIDDLVAANVIDDMWIIEGQVSGSIPVEGLTVIFGGLAAGMTTPVTSDDTFIIIIQIPQRMRRRRFRGRPRSRRRQFTNGDCSDHWRYLDWRRIDVSKHCLSPASRRTGCRVLCQSASRSRLTRGSGGDTTASPTVVGGPLPAGQRASRFRNHGSRRKASKYELDSIDCRGHPARTAASRCRTSLSPRPALAEAAAA